MKKCSLTGLDTDWLTLTPELLSSPFDLSLAHRERLTKLAPPAFGALSDVTVADMMAAELSERMALSAVQSLHCVSFHAAESENILT